MSGIKGSKSKFYIKEPLPGIENSSDTLVNVTTGDLPGARIGLDVIQHGVYEVNNTGIIGVGSAQRIIECINHGASAGDVMKVTSGNSLDAEIAIIGVIDADNFVIAYEENLSVGDTFSVLRYVSAKYSQDGSLQVSSGPIQFTKNGSAELVVEDTVTPANNEALPSKMFIIKDGVQLPVTKDTGTPSNNVAVPVELVGAAGPINITAGDLNVQLTDLGPNADVTRIGNGTNQWEMNASGEGLVHDADALAELQVISAVDFATETTLDAVKTAVEAINTKVATETTLASILANQTNSTQLTKITDGAGTVNTKQLGTALTGTDVGLVTNTTIHGLSSGGGGTYVDVKVNPAGKLLVEAGVTSSVLPTGAATEAKQDTMITSLASIAGEDFATEVTLATMSAKLPATLGQKTSANSLAVVLPSDQVVPTRENALSAGTVTDTTISGATVTTILAPVGARGMKIQAGINNTADLLVGLGGVTPDNTTNIGLEFQGGRSEDIVGASNVEVTSADPLAVNQKIVIVWSYV